MKKLFRIFVVILVVSLIALGGFYAYLQSSSGKLWLAAEISKFADGVTVNNIEGSIPSDMRVARASIADEQGIWLKLENAHISWHPFSLLHGKWNIDVVEIERIHMLREPIATETTTTPTDFSLPSLPNLIIDKLHVEEIVIEPPVTGSFQCFTIKGGSSVEGFKISAQTLAGPESNLLAELVSGKSLKADFKEVPGGVVGSLLKLPADAAISISLQAIQERSFINLNNLQADIGHTNLSGGGTYNSSDDKISGNFTFNIGDADEFSNIAGTPLAGALSGDAVISGSTENPQVKITGQSEHLEISANELSSLNILGDISEKEFSAKIDANYNKQPFSLTLHGEHSVDEIILTTLTIMYGPYNVSGKAQANLQNKDFSSEIGLAPLRLEKISPEQNGEISGNISAKGSFEQFEVKLEGLAEMPTGKISVTGNGDINSKLKQFTGSLQGKGNAGKANFTMDIPVKADANAIEVEKISLKGEGLDLGGNAIWLIDKGQADANLTLAGPDLRPLGQLLQMPMSGSVNAQITLTPGENQHGNITINASQLVFAETFLERLNIKAQGSEHKISADAETNGTIGGKPIALSMAVNGTRALEKTNLIVQEFSGNFAGEPFFMQKPAHINISPDKKEISPTILSVAGGNISFDANLTEETVNAQLNANAIALEKIPGPNLPSGTLNAFLKISGTMPRPKAVFNISGIVSGAEVPLEYHVKGGWQGRKLTGNINASNDNKNLIKADADIAALFSLSPFILGVSDASAIRGSLTLDAPLTLLNRSLYANGIRLGGSLAGSGKLAGTIQIPDIKGKFALLNGQLDHQDSGICLRGAKADIIADSKRIALHNLTASAPSGSMKTNATIELVTNGGLNGAVEFSHFPLFCGGTAKGDIDGTLQASGTVSAATLAGKLTLGPLNVQLPGSSPGEVKIPQVKTIIVSKKSKDTTPIIAAEPLMLDINITAPGRVFVRGRGLDAEFSGNLAINGPVTDLAFEGAFKAEHGRFSLLDQELKLTAATLRFNGPIPPSPFLDISAQTNVQGTLITAHLSGSAKQPDFSFTSSPSLPKDEVLALLLFKSNLSSLTPFQAIQLAQSVAELSGQSSGPGILGNIRSAIGVDRLDVGTGADNNVTVGAGKYISDKVYIGVSQGATPEDRAVTTEIEITPSISATSSIDAQGNQGVGAQWKYDY